MKIFWLFNHPAPYKVDFFNELSKKVELEVFFERATEGKRHPLFYNEKPDGFKATLCKGIKLGQINNLSFTPIKALKENKYDVVVINGWATLTEQATITYCRRNKIPYVFAINGGIKNEEEPKLKAYIKRKFISDAKAYLCPDTNSAIYLVYYGARADKISTYPYSTVFAKDVLAKPLTKEERLSYKNKHGFTGDKIFLAVGQFIERKNNDFLLDVWDKFPRKYSLYLIGSGKLLKHYKEKIMEKGYSNVFIRQFVKHDEMLDIFKGADCLLFPTKEDIYGHVVNEAFASGLPVLSSKHANASLALIKNDYNGFTLLDREELWVDKISFFKYEKYTEGAISTAKKNTIEIMVKAHLEFFTRYLEQ